MPAWFAFATGADKSAEGLTPLRPGDSLFIPAGEKHCLSNKGKNVFRLICVVPLKGEDTP